MLSLGVPTFKKMVLSYGMKTTNIERKNTNGDYFKLSYLAWHNNKEAWI